MENVTPAIVRVLPDPSEPGRFKWHLFDDRDMPLSPVIMSERTYASEEEARAEGEAAMKQHGGTP